MDGGRNSVFDNFIRAPHENGSFPKRLPFFGSNSFIKAGSVLKFLTSPHPGVPLPDPLQGRRGQKFSKFCSKITRKLKLLSSDNFYFLFKISEFFPAS